MKKLLRKSKWLHKYFGLILLLFFAWMAISGILLNHPKLIENFNTPTFITPSHYYPNNWNRKSLKGIVYTKNIKSDSIIIYGNQGVFIKAANSDSITSYMNGDYPKPARLKRTNYLIADTLHKRLLAANNKGLYICKSGSSQWKQIDLPENKEYVNKIIIANDKIVVITKSCFYVSDFTDKLVFTRKIPKKHHKGQKTISLVNVFLELHDGRIFGFPGKILWDIAALVLFFLSISAFYIWFYPKKWKRNYKRKAIRISNKKKKPYRLFYKYHTKLGWYFAIILLIIFITGIFLRPPLIITLVNTNINEKYYPNFKNNNPWHHKIRNALYDSANDRIVLDCSDGIWAGSLFDNKEFEKLDLPISIFAMGANVFKEQTKNTWLIGSFGGLEEYNKSTNSVKSLLQIESFNKGMGRPAPILVTGYVNLPNGENRIVGHYKGLCNYKGEPDKNALPMPDVIRQNYRLPLWNFFFELHNARIFKTWIGGFYILVIPLGGLLGLFVLISGIYDYIASRKRTIKN